LRQKADAVAEDGSAFGDGQFCDDLEARVGLQAGDEAAAMGGKVGPPGVIE
jgi:hypothetical protein